MGFFFFCYRHRRACWLWGRCWMSTLVWRSRRLCWSKKGLDWIKRNLGFKRYCTVCNPPWTLTMQAEASHRCHRIWPLTPRDLLLWRFHNQSKLVLRVQSWSKWLNLCVVNFMFNNIIEALCECYMLTLS